MSWRQAIQGQAAAVMHDGLAPAAGDLTVSRKREAGTKGLCQKQPEGRTTNRQSDTRAGEAGHASTRKNAAQPAGPTNERDGLNTSKEGMEARRNCQPTCRTEGYSSR